MISVLNILPLPARVLIVVAWIFSRFDPVNMAVFAPHNQAVAIQFVTAFGFGAIRAFDRGKIYGFPLLEYFLDSFAALTTSHLHNCDGFPALFRHYRASISFNVV
jgi:hypothetical protein